MTQQQEALLTYGCTGLVPNETLCDWIGPALANFEPRAIIVPGPKGMEIIKALDTLILDDEAVDFSAVKQGQGFVRCELPEKVRGWTTGRKVQISLISKTKIEGFQIYVLGVIP